MRKICMIRACSDLQNDDNVSFHRFPANEEERKGWIDFTTKTNGDVPKITKCSQLCSRHFQTCCFQRMKRSRCIIAGHLPSEFSSPGTSRTPAQHILKRIRAAPTAATEQNLILLTENRKLKLRVQQLEDRLDKKRDELKVCRQTIARLNVANQKLSAVKKRAQRTKNSSSQTTDSAGPMEGKCYSLETRKLATKISYYSAAAYNALREESNKKLPHLRTISRWNDWLNVQPGFLEACVSAISKSCVENKHLLFVMIIDEMAIRKQIIHINNSNMTGYVNYGTLKTVPKRKEATDAMFVYVNSINGNIKLPIAYFLTNKSNAILIADILKTSLERMASINATVIGITFDGITANFNACKRLGANLDIYSDDYNPSFKHPATGENVFIFPDVVHMHKLLRNALNHFIELKDDVGGIVSWRYIEELERLQAAEGLRAANKLTHRHVAFHQQKMKVKLSTQLLSSSVAAALESCRVMGIADFQGCEATVRFLKIFDRLFDLCNSRPAGQGYKSPLYADTTSDWRPFLGIAKKYLMSLKVEEVKMTPEGYEVSTWVDLAKTKRKTCATGWYTLICNIEKVMEKYVIADNCLRYLPTYRLCQDPLELLFSVIRRRLGNNNNPNIVQLMAALRSILSVKLLPGNSGNCTAQEDVACSTVTPFSRIRVETDDDDDEIPEFSTIRTLSTFVRNIVVYIAGFVGLRVSKLLSCALCRSALTVLEPYLHYRSTDFILLFEKQNPKIRDRRGIHTDVNQGLFVPSPDLVEVCRVTEQIIRMHQTGGVDKLKIKNIQRDAIQIIQQEETFGDLRTICVDDHTFESNHVLKLLELIISQYCKVRFHHIAREETVNMNPTTLRSVNNREVIFRGQ